MTKSINLTARFFNLYQDDPNKLMNFCIRFTGSGTSLPEDIQDSILRPSVSLWLGDASAETTKK